MVDSLARRAGRSGSRKQDGNIVSFSKTGKRLGTLGRKGAGPGDFQLVSRLHSDSEGVIVYDPLSQRVSSFLADGKLRSTQQIVRAEGMPPGTEMVDADARRVVWVYTTKSPRLTGDAARLTVLTSTVTGTDLTKVVAADWLPCSPPSNDGRGSSSLGIPFCHARCAPCRQVCNTRDRYACDRQIGRDRLRSPRGFFSRGYRNTFAAHVGS